MTFIAKCFGADGRSERVRGKKQRSLEHQNRMDKFAVVKTKTVINDLFIWNIKKKKKMKKIGFTL